MLRFIHSLSDSEAICACEDLWPFSWNACGLVFWVVFFPFYSVRPVDSAIWCLFFFTAANLTSAHVELITWIICPSKPTVSCMHKIWDWLNLNGMKPLLMLLITPVLPMACQNDCHEGGLLPKLSAFTGNMHSDVIQS